MKKQYDWHRSVFAAAVVLLFAGAVDPLEGSVLIGLGALLLAVVSRLCHDRHRKLFAAAAAGILTGVVYMFWISSKGGFGGDTGLSWWWGAPILVYPLGWLIIIITLIYRWVRPPKKTNTTHQNHL